MSVYFAPFQFSLYFSCISFSLVLSVQRKIQNIQPSCSVDSAPDMLFHPWMLNIERICESSVSGLVDNAAVRLVQMPVCCDTSLAQTDFLYTPHAMEQEFPRWMKHVRYQKEKDVLWWFKRNVSTKCITAGLHFDTKLREY